MLQPQNLSCGHICDPSECTGQVLTPSLSQILFKSNATLLITLTYIKFAYPPFPFLLYLSTCLSLGMYNTHSKDFFFSMLQAWLIQGPTIDK